MKMVADCSTLQKAGQKVMGVPVGTATKKYVAFMSTEQFLQAYDSKTGRAIYSDFYEDFDLQV